MKKVSALLLALFAFNNLFAQTALESVNTFIGSSKNGNTHPGAIVPWGMASVCPFNVFEGKYDITATAPYISGKPKISGFSHVNQSSLPCTDLGVILLMPFTGTIEQIKLDSANYGSAYDEESSSPGLYKTRLVKYSVKAEMTATARTGLSRYTFPSGNSNIIINLGIGLNKRKGGVIRAVSASEAEGYRLIGSNCGKNQFTRSVYFVARFSKPAAKFLVYNNTTTFHNFRKNLPGDNVGAIFSYNTKDAESIMVKVGISYVSIANARKNLEQEQSGFNFEATMKAAQDAWETELNKIAIETSNKENKIRFYSALYRSLQHPNIFSDVNGEYVSYQSDSVRKAEGYTRYSAFSLWNTYRSLHPLLSLVYPERQADMVKSMIEMYNETGWLPKNELRGDETHLFAGDPAAIVISDSYLHGIKPVDSLLAYNAAAKAALAPESDNPIRPGIDNYTKLGYIPSESAGTVLAPVSTTLEYNTADYALSGFAKMVGKKDDSKNFASRATSYRKLVDATKALHPKNAEGAFTKPYDPTRNPEPFMFLKGVPQSYLFAQAYDIKGLIEAMGGEEQSVANKLKNTFEFRIFNITSDQNLAFPFLFNAFPDNEWRGQRYIRTLTKDNFGNKPDGLPYGEDAGNSSAWLVFSMLGIYPDGPGSTLYQISSPTIDKATLKMNPTFYHGSDLVIDVKANNTENVFIQNILWNDKALKNYNIDHSEISKGGKLGFEMSKLKKKP